MWIVLQNIQGSKPDRIKAYMVKFFEVRVVQDIHAGQTTQHKKKQLLRNVKKYIVFLNTKLCISYDSSSYLLIRRSSNCSVLTTSPRFSLLSLNQYQITSPIQHRSSENEALFSWIWWHQSEGWIRRKGKYFETNQILR